MMQLISWILALSMTLCGCVSLPQSSAADVLQLPENQKMQIAQTSESTVPGKTGFMTEQIFDGADGAIHYSYYLPESYDVSRTYSMMMVMPGYNMMWFGEESSGSNFQWNGFLSWSKLDTDMIVVSAQLTDWGEKSARQAVELTEYFLNSFAVDAGRVYAAGYSAGGETMSRAVSMRPDLYAAYLHSASQWDGTYASIAENKVAVDLYMAISCNSIQDTRQVIVDWGNGLETLFRIDKNRKGYFYESIIGKWKSSSGRLHLYGAL